MCSSENTRQAVLSVLCAALKAENPLHRLTVLQRGPPFFELLEWVLQQLRAMERKEAEGGDISNLNEVIFFFSCGMLLNSYLNLSFILNVSTFMEHDLTPLDLTKVSFAHF